jgi:hypothetical protein
MFVAIRHDGQKAVGPFLSEPDGIEWAKARRQTSDENFYIRPLIEDWSL